eukprot:TRINITY_DN18786_c0_g1_i1.p1 TRINITY_DN18786_c0_g1~~TRINITY_DN18786_c0_g1_i1.p1  ORF type:complete len:102 (-),score=15.63 TRINITY_DN18786_c0_g1_i1:44-349(-)
MSSHTIILIQQTPDEDSKIYSDFTSLKFALDGLCHRYEAHLKRRNPSYREITYDISHLYDFIDHWEDIACLVFDSNTGQYRPMTKSWIKTQLLNHLRSQLP